MVMVMNERIVKNDIPKETYAHAVNVNVHIIFVVDVFCHHISDIALYLGDGKGDDQQYDQ